MLLCQFCERVLGNIGGKAAHESTCKSNPNRVHRVRSPLAGRQKGCKAWNEGLVGDPRCKLSEETKDKLRLISTGKAKTQELEAERVAKIKAKAKINNGGYRQGSGRGKKGWYKGFFCDSSYELAYIIFCLDHDIDIKRNTEIRKYQWEGRERNYIPDFVVNGEVVEIKGYKTKQWEAKLESNPDVKVLYEKDLNNVFDYVIATYGKDFVRLYE